MSMNAKEIMTTRIRYEEIFNEECLSTYCMIDEFERQYQAFITRGKLENAARVLACPLKVNPPNWQHGRMLYALAKTVAKNWPDSEPLQLLDIGTAKGFSALCMRWGADDGGRRDARIDSVDVIDPNGCVRRNTVAEIDGLRTLRQILQPWKVTERINFHQATGVQWLSEHGQRLGLAFVDGKHKYEHVSVEARLLKSRQQKGDFIMFDDVQVPGVARVVDELTGYVKQHVTLNDIRGYAVCEKQ